MIWLSSSMIGRLRDRLRAREQRLTVTLRDASKLAPDAAELLAASVEYGPLCEAMYLRMSADGKITQAERRVLKGPLRPLSEDTVLDPHMNTALDAPAKHVADHSTHGPLRDVPPHLQHDPPHST